MSPSHARDSASSMPGTCQPPMTSMGTV
jgi:hypothetical protein